jgi:putative nucleotidyltransferase with HDIG domain
MRLETPLDLAGKNVGVTASGKSPSQGKKKTAVDQVIQQIEHLPTLPQVVMRVLAMAESPRVSAIELAKAMDQSLAAKVLKMANSAYYGGRGRNISSIHHAIMLVGFEAVKEIILTTSFFHTFHDAQDVQALQPLWQHSLDCALIAKRLAWMYQYDSLDEAYLSGLTHDIGMLVIQQYFPDQWREIEKKRELGVEWLQAEREVLELTHADIGGKIAERWAFPPNLVEAIGHHHDREWKINPALGKILHYSDQYTYKSINFSQLLEAFSREGMDYPAAWDSSDLTSVEQILKEERGKSQSMFHLTTGKTPPGNPSPNP